MATFSAISDIHNTTQLRLALHEAQGIAFELLACAMEQRLPDRALLDAYRQLSQAADEAVLADDALKACNG
jgi:hypothetical protein